MLVGHKEVDMAGRKRRAPTVRWNHGSKDGLGERGQQGKDRVRFRPSSLPPPHPSEMFSVRVDGGEGGRDRGRKAERGRGEKKTKKEER